MAGSRASASIPQGWDTFRKLHALLLEERVLVPDPADPKLFGFTSDYAFKSSSAAGSVVCANTVSGPAVWIPEDSSISYGAWREAKLPPPQGKAA